MDWMPEAKDSGFSSVLPDVAQNEELPAPQGIPLGGPTKNDAVDNALDSHVNGNVPVEKESDGFSGSTGGMKEAQSAYADDDLDKRFQDVLLGNHVSGASDPFSSRLQADEEATHTTETRTETQSGVPNNSFHDSNPFQGFEGSVGPVTPVSIKEASTGFGYHGEEAFPASVPHESKSEQEKVLASDFDQLNFDERKQSESMEYKHVDVLDNNTAGQDTFNTNPFSLSDANAVADKSMNNPEAEVVWSSVTHGQRDSRMSSGELHLEHPPTETEHATEDKRSEMSSDGMDEEQAGVHHAPRQDLSITNPFTSGDFNAEIDVTKYRPADISVFSTAPHDLGVQHDGDFMPSSEFYSGRLHAETEVTGESETSEKRSDDVGEEQTPAVFRREPSVTNPFTSGDFGANDDVIKDSPADESVLSSTLYARDDHTIPSNETQSEHAKVVSALSSESSVHGIGPTISVGFISVGEPTTIEDVNKMSASFGDSDAETPPVDNADASVDESKTDLPAYNMESSGNTQSPSDVSTEQLSTAEKVVPIYGQNTQMKTSNRKSAQASGDSLSYTDPEDRFVQQENSVINNEPMVDEEKSSSEKRLEEGSSPRPVNELLTHDDRGFNSSVELTSADSQGDAIGAATESTGSKADDMLIGSKTETQFQYPKTAFDEGSSNPNNEMSQIKPRDASDEVTKSDGLVHDESKTLDSGMEKSSQNVNTEDTQTIASFVETHASLEQNIGEVPAKTKTTGSYGSSLMQDDLDVGKKTLQDEDSSIYQEDDVAIKEAMHVGNVGKSSANKMTDELIQDRDDALLSSAQASDFSADGEDAMSANESPAVNGHAANGNDDQLERVAELSHFGKLESKQALEMGHSDPSTDADFGAELLSSNEDDVLTRAREAESFESQDTDAYVASSKVKREAMIPEIPNTNDHVWRAEVPDDDGIETTGERVENHVDSENVVGIWTNPALVESDVPLKQSEDSVGITPAEAGMRAEGYFVIGNSDEQLQASDELTRSLSSTLKESKDAGPADSSGGAMAVNSKLSRSGGDDITFGTNVDMEKAEGSPSSLDKVPSNMNMQRTQDDSIKTGNELSIFEETTNDKLKASLVSNEQPISTEDAENSISDSIEGENASLLKADDAEEVRPMTENEEKDSLKIQFEKSQSNDSSQTDAEKVKREDSSFDGEVMVAELESPFSKESSEEKSTPSSVNEMRSDMLDCELSDTFDDTRNQGVVEEVRDLFVDEDDDQKRMVHEPTQFEDVGGSSFTSDVSMTPSGEVPSKDDDDVLKKNGTEAHFQGISTCLGGGSSKLDEDVSIAPQLSDETILKYGTTIRTKSAGEPSTQTSEDAFHVQESAYSVSLHGAKNKEEEGKDVHAPVTSGRNEEKIEEQAGLGELTFKQDMEEIDSVAESLIRSESVIPGDDNQLGVNSAEGHLQSPHKDSNESSAKLDMEMTQDETHVSLSSPDEIFQERTDIMEGGIEKTSQNEKEGHSDQPHAEPEAEAFFKQDAGETLRAGKLTDIDGYSLKGDDKDSVDKRLQEDPILIQEAGVSSSKGIISEVEKSIGNEVSEVPTINSSDELYKHAESSELKATSAGIGTQETETDNHSSTRNENDDEMIARTENLTSRESGFNEAGKVKPGGDMSEAVFSLTTEPTHPNSDDMLPRTNVTAEDMQKTQTDVDAFSSNVKTESAVAEPLIIDEQAASPELLDEGKRSPSENDADNAQPIFTHENAEDSIKQSTPGFSARDTLTDVKDVDPTTEDQEMSYMTLHKDVGEYMLQKGDFNHLQEDTLKMPAEEAVHEVIADESLIESRANPSSTADSTVLNPDFSTESVRSNIDYMRMEGGATEEHLDGSQMDVQELSSSLDKEPMHIDAQKVSDEASAPYVSVDEENRSRQEEGTEKLVVSEKTEEKSASQPLSDTHEAQATNPPQRPDVAEVVAAELGNGELPKTDVDEPYQIQSDLAELRCSQVDFGTPSPNVAEHFPRGYQEDFKSTQEGVVHSDSDTIGKQPSPSSSNISISSEDKVEPPDEVAPQSDELMETRLSDNGAAKREVKTMDGDHTFHLNDSESVLSTGDFNDVVVVDQGSADEAEEYNDQPQVEEQQTHLQTLGLKQSLEMSDNDSLEDGKAFTGYAIEDSIMPSNAAPEEAGDPSNGRAVPISILKENENVGANGNVMDEHGALQLHDLTGSTLQSSSDEYDELPMSADQNSILAQYGSKESANLSQRGLNARIPDVNTNSPKTDNTDSLSINDHLLSDVEEDIIQSRSGPEISELAREDDDVTERSVEAPNREALRNTELEDVGTLRRNEKQRTELEDLNVGRDVKAAESSEIFSAVEDVQDNISTSIASADEPTSKSDVGKVLGDAINEDVQCKTSGEHEDEDFRTMESVKEDAAQQKMDSFDLKMKPSIDETHGEPSRTDSLNPSTDELTGLEHIDASQTRPADDSVPKVGINEPEMETQDAEVINEPLLPDVHETITQHVSELKIPESDHEDNDEVKKQNVNKLNSDLLKTDAEDIIIQRGSELIASEPAPADGDGLVIRQDIDALESKLADAEPEDVNVLRDGPDELEFEQSPPKIDEQLSCDSQEKDTSAKEAAAHSANGHQVQTHDIEDMIIPNQNEPRSDDGDGGLSEFLEDSISHQGATESGRAKQDTDSSSSLVDGSGNAPAIASVGEAMDRGTVTAVADSITNVTDDPLQVEQWAHLDNPELKRGKDVIATDLSEAVEVADETRGKPPQSDYLNHDSEYLAYQEHVDPAQTGSLKGNVPETSAIQPVSDIDDFEIIDTPIQHDVQEATMQCSSGLVVSELTRDDDGDVVMKQGHTSKLELEDVRTFERDSGQLDFGQHPSDIAGENMTYEVEQTVAPTQQPTVHSELDTLGQDHIHHLDDMVIPSQDKVEPPCKDTDLRGKTSKDFIAQGSDDDYEAMPQHSDDMFHVGVAQGAPGVASSNEEVGPGMVGQDVADLSQTEASKETVLGVDFSQPETVARDAEAINAPLEAEVEEAVVQSSSEMVTSESTRDDGDTDMKQRVDTLNSEPLTVELKDLHTLTHGSAQLDFEYPLPNIVEQPSYDREENIGLSQETGAHSDAVSLDQGQLHHLDKMALPSKSEPERLWDIDEQQTPLEDSGSTNSKDMVATRSSEADKVANDDQENVTTSNVAVVEPIRKTSVKELRSNELSEGDGFLPKESAAEHAAPHLPDVVGLTLKSKTEETLGEPSQIDILKYDTEQPAGQENAELSQADSVEENLPDVGTRQLEVDIDDFEIIKAPVPHDVEEAIIWSSDELVVSERSRENDKAIVNQSTGARKSDQLETDFEDTSSTFRQNSAQPDSEQHLPDIAEKDLTHEGEEAIPAQSLPVHPEVDSSSNYPFQHIGDTVIPSQGKAEPPGSDVPLSGEPPEGPTTEETAECDAMPQHSDDMSHHDAGDDVPVISPDESVAHKTVGQELADGSQAENLNEIALKPSVNQPEMDTQEIEVLNALLPFEFEKTVIQCSSELVASEPAREVGDAVMKERMETMNSKPLKAEFEDLNIQTAILDHDHLEEMVTPSQNETERLRDTNEEQTCFGDLDFIHKDMMATSSSEVAKVVDDVQDSITSSNTIVEPVRKSSVEDLRDMVVDLVVPPQDKEHTLVKDAALSEETSKVPIHEGTVAADEPMSRHSDGMLHLQASLEEHEVSSLDNVMDDETVNQGISDSSQMEVMNESASEVTVNQSETDTCDTEVFNTPLQPEVEETIVQHNSELVAMERAGEDDDSVVKPSTDTLNSDPLKTELEDLHALIHSSDQLDFERPPPTIVEHPRYDSAEQVAFAHEPAAHSDSNAQGQDQTHPYDDMSISSQDKMFYEPSATSIDEAIGRGTVRAVEESVASERDDVEPPENSGLNFSKEVMMIDSGDTVKTVDDLRDYITTTKAVLDDVLNKSNVEEVLGDTVSENGYLRADESITNAYGLSQSSDTNDLTLQPSGDEANKQLPQTDAVTHASHQHTVQEHVESSQRDPLKEDELEESISQLQASARDYINNPSLLHEVEETIAQSNSVLVASEPVREEDDVVTKQRTDILNEESPEKEHENESTVKHGSEKVDFEQPLPDTEDEDLMHEGERKVVSVQEPTEQLEANIGQEQTHHLDEMIISRQAASGPPGNDAALSSELLKEHVSDDGFETQKVTRNAVDAFDIDAGENVHSRTSFDETMDFGKPAQFEDTASHKNEDPTLAEEREVPSEDSHFERSVDLTDIDPVAHVQDDSLAGAAQIDAIASHKVSGDSVDSRNVGEMSTGLLNEGNEAVLVKDHVEDDHTEPPSSDAIDLRSSDEEAHCEPSQRNTLNPTEEHDPYQEHVDSPQTESGKQNISKVKISQPVSGSDSDSDTDHRLHPDIADSQARSDDSTHPEVEEAVIQGNRELVASEPTCIDDDVIVKQSVDLKNKEPLNTDADDVSTLKHSSDRTHLEHNLANADEYSSKAYDIEETLLSGQEHQMHSAADIFGERSVYHFDDIIIPSQDKPTPLSHESVELVTERPISDEGAGDSRQVTRDDHSHPVHFPDNGYPSGSISSGTGKKELVENTQELFKANELSDDDLANYGVYDEKRDLEQVEKDTKTDVERHIVKRQLQDESEPDQLSGTLDRSIAPSWTGRIIPEDNPSEDWTSDADYYEEFRLQSAEQDSVPHLQGSESRQQPSNVSQQPTETAESKHVPDTTPSVEAEPQSRPEILEDVVAVTTRMTTLEAEKGRVVMTDVSSLRDTGSVERPESSAFGTPPEHMPLGSTTTPPPHTDAATRKDSGPLGAYPGSHDMELEKERVTPETLAADEDQEDQFDEGPELEYDEPIGESAWRMCVVGGKEQKIDMNIIEPYTKVLSHGGYMEGDSGQSIIVFAACHLPERSLPDYAYVMDNLFLYVLTTLDELVSEEYVLVYLHGGASSASSPGFSWLRRAYQLVDRRLRKTLKGLYLVHPSFWLRTIVALTRPFISSKFSRKLRYVEGLRELSDLIPMNHVMIPEEVKQVDFQLMIAERKKELNIK